jgi:hypothetical protein
MSKRDRWIRVLIRTLEAEALSRYLILAYLNDRNLWPHFQKRTDIDAFWDLKPREFRKRWPSRIDFPSIARSFDRSALREHPNDH